MWALELTAAADLLQAIVSFAGAILFHQESTVQVGAETPSSFATIELYWFFLLIGAQGRINEVVDGDFQSTEAAPRCASSLPYRHQDTRRNGHKYVTGGMNMTTCVLE